MKLEDLVDPKTILIQRIEMPRSDGLQVGYGACILMMTHIPSDTKVFDFEASAGDPKVVRGLREKMVHTLIDTGVVEMEKPKKLTIREYNDLITSFEGLFWKLKAHVPINRSHTNKWAKALPVMNPTGKDGYYDFRIYFPNPCPSENLTFDNSEIMLLIQHFSCVIDFDPDLIGFELIGNKKVAKFFPITPY